MSRIRISAAVWTTVTTAVLFQPAMAAPPQPIAGPPHFRPAPPAAAYPVAALPAAPVDVPYPYPYHPYANGRAPGYPVLDAPMNPVPVPNVPVQVGSTMITNQALYPHEMLYPHRYRAMYPPFYYTMTGRWQVTPWGVRSHEHWRLRGTEVKVKYHSSISPFALFHPPSIR